MAINNIFFISFAKILLFWFFLCLLAGIINYRHKQKLRNFHKKNFKESHIKGLLFLDQFFITNKFYTIFITFIYVFGMFIIIIILRYLALGNIVEILPRENNIYNFAIIIYIYMVIIITFFLKRCISYLFYLLRLIIIILIILFFKNIY